MLRRSLALAFIASCNCYSPLLLTRELTSRSRATSGGVHLRLFARQDPSSWKPSRRDAMGWMTAGVASALLQGYATPADAVISDFAKLRELEDLQAEIFEQSVPSVCFISTEYTSMAQQLNLDSNSLPKGVGSGFVWDDKGHIVTNFHVINKVDSAVVVLTKTDGTTEKYKAKLTGVDPDKDIAVLKIDAPASLLRKLPVGDSSKIKVGQFSFAIGNPFGQDHTLTSGIISGKNREITAPTGRKIKGVIQTDAAINPGNSGGPLLNSQGQLIGINTASLGAGVSAGVGFAVPIDLAVPTIEQLIEFGQVQRAILGISYLERVPTASESERSGIPRIEKGIVVLEVPPNSPAAAAGMIAVKRSKDPKSKPELGDVIVGIDQYEIKDPLDLSAVLAKYKPGNKVSVKVLRGPEQTPQTLALTLGAFQGSAFTKLENERGADFAAKGTPLNVPLSEIAPAITPRMPSAN
mmetsp:Transcript_3458/g.8430  ORF Transcript_3458/g.8430 Transcript_3458/m.8430 type:complete len:466 (-) Transcript_3458:59-1456(-)